MKKLILTILAVALMATPSFSDTLSRNTTWSSRQVLSSTALNAEFDNLVSWVNAGKLPDAVTTSTIFEAAQRFSGEVGITGALKAYSTLHVDGVATLGTAVISGTISEGGTSLVSKYLGITARASDSLKLGGNTAATFMPSKTTMEALLTGTITSHDHVGTAGSFTTLAASGAAQLNGGLTMDTDKFTVNDGTGNTTIAGTLDVAGKGDFAAAAYAARVNLGDIAIHANQISNDATNGNAVLHLNYTGYQGGTTQYRDLYISDGKQATMALFDGSAGTHYRYAPAGTIAEILNSFGNLTLGATDLASTTYKLAINGTGTPSSAIYTLSDASEYALIAKMNSDDVGATFTPLLMQGDDFNLGAISVTTVDTTPTPSGSMSLKTLYNGTIKTAFIINDSQNVSLAATDLAGATNKLLVEASSDTHNQLVLSDSDAYNATPMTQLNMRGKYNASGTYANFAYLRASKENGTDANQLGKLEFATNTGAAANICGVANSSGNWTLGATDLASTTSKLYVDGTSIAAGSYAATFKITDQGNGVRILNNSNLVGAGRGGTLIFGGGTDTGGVAQYASVVSGVIDNTNATPSGDLSIYTLNNGTVTKAFIINDSQNVSLSSTDEAGTLYRLMSAGNVKIRRSAAGGAVLNVGSTQNLLGNNAGEIAFYGRDYAGAEKNYAVIASTVLGNTPAGVCGGINLQVINSGTLTNGFILNDSANVTLHTSDLAGATAKQFNYQNLPSKSAFVWGKLAATPYGALTCDFAEGGKQGGWIYLMGEENPANYIAMGVRGNSSAGITGIIRHSGTFEVQDSGGNIAMRLDASEDVFFPGHATTASAANAFFDSSTGALLRSTSSRRYKENITPLPFSWSSFDRLRPVTFTPKGKNDRHVGFISEEVAEVYPEVVEFMGGRPEGVQYGHITAINTAAIQDLKRENDELKSRVERLEAMILHGKR